MQDNKSKEVAKVQDHKVPAKAIDFKDLDQFQAHLGADPTRVEVHEGVDYVPIAVLYARLDATYLGLWSVDITHTAVIANELEVLISLSVFHPVHQVWIRRAGAAAVPIQQDRGAGVMEIEKKKKVAIQKNLPAALALAVKNAAKTLGPHFGRHLNKKGKTEDLLPFEALDMIENKFYDEDGLKAELKAIKPTRDGTALQTLDALWKKNQVAIMAVPAIKKAFLTRRNQLKAKMQKP